MDDADELSKRQQKARSKLKKRFGKVPLYHFIYKKLGDTLTHTKSTP